MSIKGLEIFLLVLTLAGCMIVGHEEYSRSFTKTFEVNDNAELNVDNSSGKVEVTAWDKKSIEIKYTITGRGTDSSDARDDFERIEVILVKNNNSVTAEYSRKERGSLFNSGMRGYVNFDIRVPSDCSVNLDVSSGKIRVEGIKNKLTADASSGSINIKNSTGRIKAEASSGEISIEECSGTIYADASSGMIRIVNSSGNVRAECSSGSIYINNFNGALDLESSSGSLKVIDARLSGMRANASSGSIRVEGSFDDKNKYIFDASSGDIIIILRENKIGYYKLKSSSGSIFFDSSTDRVIRTKKTLEARSDKGNATMYVSTTSGDITISELK